MTGTSDPQSQLKAINELTDATEKEFMEKLKHEAPNDLTAFAEYINPLEPPAPHHIFICDHLMAAERGDLMRCAISLPPGSAKSSYGSRMFPAWYLGKNSRNKVIQAGHTQTFVESEFGKKTRDIIETPEFRDVFPDVSIAHDSRSAGRWNLNNPRGGYIAKGAGQKIAGFRGNIAIVDDPIGSRQDAESETVREKLYNWYTADVMTRLLPHSPLFIIATRWHSDDLIGRLEHRMNHAGGETYEIINIPAICEDESVDPLRRKEGEHLWPEYYPLSHYEKLKITLNVSDWLSLYQGQPVDAQGGVVKKEWFKSYSGDPRNFTEVRRIILSVDTAYTKTQRSDYSVIMVMLQDMSGKHYVLDVIRKRLEFTELTEEIENTARRYKANAILIENKGAGTSYIQSRQGKAPAPIIPIEVNNKSKEFRFDEITPVLHAGLVYLPDKANFLPALVAELVSFPRGRHDDQIDVLSQYLKWVSTGINRGKTKKIAMNGGRTQRDEMVRKVERGIEKMIEEKRQKDVITSLE
jgi:predicted phage terminase large subunit-like protein